MANIITVFAVNAETDSPIGLFEHDGKTVSFSVALVAVSSELAASEVAAAFESLRAEAGNSPIAPGEPPEKTVVGTPGFGEVFSGKLTEAPRIIRVDDGLVLNLTPVPETAGWYIAAIPDETSEYEVDPSVHWFGLPFDNESAPFTFFSKTLTPLAREVLEMRAKAKVQLALLSQQWGGESPTVWDMVHNYVENTLGLPEHEGLRDNWIGDLSWAVIDFAIPAREFDLLVERRSRILAILSEVPWPDLPYFERCAWGIPVTQGVAGEPLSILNWRICVPTFSDYFPRTDKQIKTDLGAVWLDNLGPIFECIVRKVAAKAEEAQRSAKFWKFASILVVPILLPLPANMLTAVYELAESAFMQNVNPAWLQVAQVAKSVISGLVSGGAATTGLGIPQKGYELAVGQIKALLEQQGIEELKALAKDAEKLKAIVQDTTGLDQLPPALKPFIVWCLRVTILDLLIAEILGSILDTDVDPQETVTFPALEDAMANGVEVPDSLVSLANGEDPDFPAQPPGSLLGQFAGGSALVGVGVLTYLQLAGKLL